MAMLPLRTIFPLSSSASLRHIASRGVLIPRQRHQQLLSLPSSSSSFPVPSSPPSWSSSPLPHRRTYASAGGGGGGNDNNQFNASTSGKPSADDLARNPEIRDIVDKMTRSPGAMAALQRLSQLMRDLGVEPSKPGEMPSKMAMMKLFVNAEFRGAVKELGDELEKAGVHMNQESLTEMMKAMSQGTR